MRCDRKNKDKKSSENTIQTPPWPQKISPHIEQKISNDELGPLARQVVPQAEEQILIDGFSPDPVGDHQADLGDGLLIKYDGRALLLTTLSCAIHCRFCFRRAYRSANSPTTSTRQRAIFRLSQMPHIREIILSGGDPLTLNNVELATILEQIDSIRHIERIRIHTRMFTAAPNRIDESLCRILTNSRKQLIIVTHVNHPDELDDATFGAITRLRNRETRRFPLMLLNQSVLLREVNDNAECLIALSERLISFGILPYYLHQLDRVVGAHHFEVPVEQGLQIIETMRRRCPGYMIPRYVQEIPSEPSKTPL